MSSNLDLVLIGLVSMTILLILGYTLYQQARPQDCQVTAWGPWSTCSQSCGGGTRSRIRTITELPRNGGAGCPGLREEQECHTQVCDQDCQVSNWSDWSECSDACGGGIQQRIRRVVVPATGAGVKCPNLKEERPCNEQGCARDCQVSAWSEWGPCNADCGEGEQARERVVTQPPQNEGGECPPLREVRACNLPPCQTDCQVGDWYPVGDCSHPCGGGTQRYQREVVVPAKGGKSCPSLEKTEPCPQVPCPPNYLKILPYQPELERLSWTHDQIGEKENVPQLQQRTRYTLLVSLNPVSELTDQIIRFSNILSSGEITSHQLSSPLQSWGPQKYYLHFTTGNLYQPQHYATKTPYLKIRNTAKERDEILTMTDPAGQADSLSVYYDPNLQLLSNQGRTLVNTTPLSFPPEQTPRYFMVSLGETKIVFEVINYRVTALKVKPEQQDQYYREFGPVSQLTDLGSFDGTHLVILAQDLQAPTSRFQFPGSEGEYLMQGEVNQESMKRSRTRVTSQGQQVVDLRISVQPYEGVF